MFEIKWLGYADITTEPWANVRLHDVVHQYLKHNDMAELIPKDRDPKPKVPKDKVIKVAKGKAKKATKVTNIKRTREARAANRVPSISREVTFNEGLVSGFSQ
jgi:hypothetical protein